jgi:hypothetical protein
MGFSEVNWKSLFMKNQFGPNATVERSRAASNFQMIDIRSLNNLIIHSIDIASGLNGLSDGLKVARLSRSLLYFSEIGTKNC